LGGNPIACAAGLVLLKEIKSKKLLANAEKVGAQLADGLKALQRPTPPSSSKCAARA